jgi:hypothetical protein
MVKKPKLNLLDDENEENENNDEASELKINKNYAQRYDNWRSKEELQRCKLILMR